MEEAHTGGLKSFVYSGQEENKLDPETEKKIDLAYEKYYKRKRRNKILLVSVGLIIVLVLGYFLIF